MISNSMSNVYLTQGGDVYFKMTQLISEVVFVLCIFLLIPLLRYCYAEANTFVKQDNADIIKKADELYIQIFNYLKKSLIFLIVLFALSALTESIQLTIGIMKQQYAWIFVLLLIVSYFITECVMIKFFHIKDSVIKSFIICFFVVLFCLQGVLLAIPDNVLGNIFIKYQSNNITISIDANKKFEKLLMKVNGKEVQNIDMLDHGIYFYTSYITKEAEETEKKESNERNYVKEFNSDYYFYNIDENISKHVIKGRNMIEIKITIDDTTYSFVNPMDFNGDEYHYLKDKYETEIRIK